MKNDRPFLEILTSCLELRDYKKQRGAVLSADVSVLKKATILIPRKKCVHLTLPRQNLHPESFEQAVGTPYLKNHNIQALILPLSTASEIL